MRYSGRLRRHEREYGKGSAPARAGQTRTRIRKIRRRPGVLRGPARGRQAGAHGGRTGERRPIINPRKITAALLLIGGIGLLQYHAILFWTAAVDPLTGWAWSLLLECAALWCWSHHRAAIRWGLGAVATVLVLAGPLYQVAKPLGYQGDKQ
jgi:hypothetical protein